MKKIITKAALLIALTSYTSTANAQLSDFLNNVASKVQSTTSNSDNSLLSSVGSIILNKLIPTSTQIVGTWIYKEPAVMFTSDNTLSKTASSLVTKQAESYLQNILAKTNINSGNMSMTFEKDKSFYISLNDKKIGSGTYTLSNSDVTLTFKGRKQACKVTPQLDNGTLVIVMDATKLKTFLENIGSNVSHLSTITSLMKSMDGMKVGIRMTKK